MGVVSLYCIFTFIRISFARATIFASLIFAGVGIGKEILDRHTTLFSYGDLAADASGILLGTMIVIFLLKPKPPG